MDYLWSPWRFQYTSKANGPVACIFCEKAAQRADEDNLIVHRAAHTFVILNLFPYTTGHLMVVPYDHVSSLAAAKDEALTEMILLTKFAQAKLSEIYSPHGLNIGMNLGESAGAGIAGHIHMHVLPRWAGDTNFMSTIAETRVLPEELPVSLARLRAVFLGGEPAAL